MTPATLAWLFPGQGSQAVGMGRDLYERSPAARQVLDATDRALGTSLTRLMFDGPADELQLTLNAQPAIVATSLAALAAFREAAAEVGATPPDPGFVAGHSVGEYAALVACGAAPEDVAMRLVRERGRLMHEAGQATPGSMVAVLGLAREAVAEACRRAREQVPGSFVDVANHNAATQVIIAGDPGGLQAAGKLCQAAGARRCLPLPVSGAFHSRAMAPAAAALAGAIGAAGIGDARVPLVGNVEARPLLTAADLRRELAEQVARPVLWAETIEHMVAAGAGVFLEFGAGQVLTNLVQRAHGHVAAMAVGDTDGARAAVAWLAAAMRRSP